MALSWPCIDTGLAADAAWDTASDRVVWIGGQNAHRRSSGPMNEWMNEWPYMSVNYDKDYEVFTLPKCSTMLTLRVYYILTHPFLIVSTTVTPEQQRTVTKYEWYTAMWCRNDFKTYRVRLVQLCLLLWNSKHNYYRLVINAERFAYIAITLLNEIQYVEEYVKWS